MLQFWFSHLESYNFLTVFLASVLPTSNPFCTLQTNLHLIIPLKSITHSTSYATAPFIEFSEIIKIVYNSTVKSGREGGGGGGGMRRDQPQNLL